MYLKKKKEKKRYSNSTVCNCLKKLGGPECPRLLSKRYPPIDGNNSTFDYSF